MKNLDFSTIEDCIFFRLIGCSPKKWELLSYLGKSFTNLQEAIDFVRKNDDGSLIELAAFQQMKLNNGEWDNL